MNAIAPLSGVRAVRDEVVAAWLVAPGAMMLLGRGSPPAHGTAQIERRRTDRGPFRARSWSLPDGTHAFCAALRLPASTHPQPQQSIVLHGGASELAAPLPDFADGAAFAVAAAELAGPSGAMLARFLADTFPAAALQRAPGLGAMLAAFLSRVAPQDGVIELAGQLTGCAFLQGWGVAVAEDAEILLTGRELGRFAVRVATFARADVAAAATGVVLVLPPEAAPLLEGLDEAFVLGASSVHRLTPYQRRLMGAVESVGHMRDMLPQLRCDPVVTQGLRAALRPRYEGRETLSGLGAPVRAAIDLAVASAGGVYVAGWLLDPQGLVESVTLCGEGSVRLDPGWTRVLREDVGAAFAELVPAGADAAHGFAAFARGVAGRRLHLEVTLRDGSCGFVPVAVLADTRSARARLLASVDLFKPSGLAVVQRQLAPALTAFDAGARVPVAVPERASVSAHRVIVVPLATPVLPRALLSGFLHDPLSADEALLLVCGPTWDDAAVLRLRGMLGFMGLDAAVLRAEADDEAAALDVAVACSAGATLLLLDPGGLGATPGWRAALAAALGERTDACACPVLLHEDRSIRHAGVSGLRRLAGPPFAAPVREMAGLPAALLGSEPPRPTATGTLLCCLLPRPLLAALGGARHGGATAWGREAAFFARLRAVGGTCLMVPAARVIAPDPHPEPLPHEAVARLVDGWRLHEALAGDVS